MLREEKGECGSTAGPQHTYPNLFMKTIEKLNYFLDDDDNDDDDDDRPFFHEKFTKIQL